MSETRKEPPVSYRFGADREVRFRKFQHRHKLKQSEAMHRLIDRGLDAEGIPPSPKRG